MRNWTPFIRLDHFDQEFKRLAISGIVNPQVERWINAEYVATLDRQVECGDGWPCPMMQLAIHRRDKKPIHDWRDLQRIKNEVVGPEYEGMEMLPAESRLVDSSNVYFIFVFNEPKFRWPFGFGTRWVSNVSENGSVQRPFELNAMPKDCKTLAEFTASKQITHENTDPPSEQK